MNAGKAQVDAAKAALDAAQLDLSFTRVTAPISGRVGQTLVTEGNYVASGVTPLTTIVSINPLHVYFDVDERTYLRSLAADRANKTSEAAKVTKVMVALIADKTYTRPGRVDFLANSADRSTGTVRVRAVVDNPDGQLTPVCSPKSNWRLAHRSPRCWFLTCRLAPTRAAAMCWSLAKTIQQNTGRSNLAR